MYGVCIGRTCRIRQTEIVCHGRVCRKRCTGRFGHRPDADGGRRFCTRESRSGRHPRCLPNRRSRRRRADLRMDHLSALPNQGHFLCLFGRSDHFLVDERRGGVQPRSAPQDGKCRRMDARNSRPLYGICDGHRHPGQRGLRTHPKDQCACRAGRAARGRRERGVRSCYGGVCFCASGGNSDF